MTRQQELLRRLEEEPGESLSLALARSGVSQGQLRHWKKTDEIFLIAYNRIARARSEPPVRIAAPRQATVATARRVLASFDADPLLGLTAHCRAAGTTVKNLEAACAGDPQLQDLLETAKDAAVAPVEQAQLNTLVTDPKATAARAKFLARNGSGMWGETAAEEGDRKPVVVNLALLHHAPKARQLEEGYAPVDLPVQRLKAADRLPGMEDES